MSLPISFVSEKCRTVKVNRFLWQSINIPFFCIFQKLDENSSEHSRWEHDLLFLRQQLQASASRDMQHGIDRSAETLAIEGELAQVQQRAAELHRHRQEILNDMQVRRFKDFF